MSQAPALAVTLRITLEDAWSPASVALFGRPENFAEELADRAREKLEADEVQIVSVEIVPPS